jgi:hypothetical protein
LGSSSCSAFSRVRLDSHRPDEPGFDAPEEARADQSGAELERRDSLSGGSVTKMRDADEWTIERWKTEPKLVSLVSPEFNDATVEKAPALWKDLALASALAVLLWGAVALVFG